VTQSTVILIILSLFLGLAAWFVFLWAVRSGEFDDPEGPKHRMLEEEDTPVPPRPPVSSAEDSRKQGAP